VIRLAAYVFGFLVILLWLIKQGVAGVCWIIEKGRGK